MSLRTSHKRSDDNLVSAPSTASITQSMTMSQGEADDTDATRSAIFRKHIANMISLVDNDKDAPFVDKIPFNAFIGLAVVVSTIMLGVEMDNELGTAGVVVDIFFAVVWLGEMGLRVYYHGFKVYIRDAANKLDFFLALMAGIDAMVMPFVILFVGSGVNLRLVTLLKVLRLLRVVRILRLVTFFRELWLLVKGMIDAGPVLVWVVVMIILEVYIAALLMTSLVGHDCHTVYSDWNECMEFFGDMGSSMFSLFQVMTLDSWAMPIAKPLVKEKPYMMGFIVVFLYSTTFGTMNLVVGVLVDHIMRATQEDALKMEKAKERAQKHELGVLKKIFQEADTTGDGTVDITEFMEVCASKDVQAHFQVLDIPVGRRRLAKRVFEVLDAEGTGQMSIVQFIDRVKQLKAEGKGLSKDQTLLLMDVRHLSRRLQKLAKHIIPEEGAEDARASMAITPGHSPALPKAAKFPAQAQNEPSAMEQRLGALITSGLEALGERVQTVESSVARLSEQMGGLTKAQPAQSVAARTAPSFSSVGDSQPPRRAHEKPVDVMICFQPARREPPTMIPAVPQGE